MILLSKTRSTSTCAIVLAACIALPAPIFAQASGKPPASETPATKGDAPAQTPKESAANAKADSPKAGPPSANQAKAGDVQAGQAKDPRVTDREAFFDARLAALHAGLTLAADQEPLWPPVEAAMRGFEKTRDGREGHADIETLLHKSPSDLVRMRAEQLLKRGEAMRKLVDATGPLVDKLDDTQKRRLPLLLQDMHPSRILSAAFDIRYGRVMDDPDDDAGPKASRRGAYGGDETDDGMGRHHPRMHERDGGGRDEADGAAYDDGRGDPTTMHGDHAANADD